MVARALRDAGMEVVYTGIRQTPEMIAEAALQVRGMAGEHQVDGARMALGHAYGGGAQYFAMWVVGADKP